jgi:hypothetical protein
VSEVWDPGQHASETIAGAIFQEDLPGSLDQIFCVPVEDLGERKT